MIIFYVRHDVNGRTVYSFTTNSAYAQKFAKDVNGALYWAINTFAIGVLIEEYQAYWINEDYTESLIDNYKTNPFSLWELPTL